MTVKRTTNAYGLLALPSAALILVACGGGGSNPAPAPATFSIQWSSVSPVLPVGGSVDVAIFLNRDPGTSDSVSLSVSGLPAGVTAAFAPATTTGSSSLLTLTATAAVPEGNYSLDVIATGSNGTLNRKALAFQVKTQSMFALVMPTSAPQLTIGQSLDVPVTVQRMGGYTAPVTFALGTCPAGLSGQFKPATTTTGSTVLSLTGDAALQPGTYQLPVTVTGAGSAPDTKSLTVVVQAQKFTLGAFESLAPLYPGSVQTLVVPIQRLSGFAGAVDFTVVAPNGFHAAFSPGTGDASVMTLVVDPGVAAGSYSLVVKGAATGSASYSQTLQVTVQGAQVAGFQVGVPAASPSLNPGGSATLDLTLQRFGGFTGAVDYVLTGAPAGLTATFQAEGAGARMTLTAGANVQPGSYDLTVKGQSGSLVDARRLTVRVVAATASGFSLQAPASLTLEQGIWSDSLWTGSTTVTLDRVNGFTDAVDVAILGLPPGMSAGCQPSRITGSTTELSVQVGDNVAPGDYLLTLVGTSVAQPTVKDARALRVTVAKNKAGFGMSFLNEARTQLDWRTNLPVAAGQSRTLGLYTYTTKNSALDSQGYAVSYPNPITLTLDAAPAGVSATFKSNPVTADDETNTVTFIVAQDVPIGSYPIRLKAYDPVKKITNWLDLSLTVGQGTFFIKPGLMAKNAMEVATGQSITVPLELARNDVFWNVAGQMPVYLGTTDLSVLDAPTGLSVTLAEASPAGAVTALTVAASGSVLPGSYAFTLRARRGGVNQDQSIPVKVTASAGSPDLWIQGIEWGQTVLQSGLRLVPGKPALLRANILADRTGVTGVTAQAVVHTPGLADLTLPLTGPATAPVSVAEGMLAQSYTVLVPGERITPGFTVDVTADPGNQVSESDETNNHVLHTPTVGTARDLNLVIVPIIQQGIYPNMPTAAEFQKPIRAFWPLRSVNVSYRAPYVTSVSIPQDPNSQGGPFTTMMYEMLALRMLDGVEGKCGASDHYFGMVGVKNFQGGILGIHNAGLPAGLGLDKSYQDPWDTNNNLITSAITAVHELGHGFNLRHAPDGQAGGPNENYPYQKAKIGSWGLDTTEAVPTLYNPSTFYDIMSYTNPLWVSDFNYLNAFNFLETTKDRDWSLVQERDTPSAPRMLISGFISPDGSVQVHPVVHATTEAIQPVSGHELTLRLKTVRGTRVVAFETQELEDLPPGYKAFAFTVDGQDEILALDILQGGQLKVQAAPALARTQRLARLSAAKGQEGYLIKETDGDLQVTWDASVHPYAALIHVDATGKRTALGVRLTGGEVRLPSASLPKGGSFQLVLSDGLNPLTVRIERARS